MRTTLTVLLGICVSNVNAQLVNGDFEDGLNGWIYAPHDEATGQWSITDVFPEGGGSGSVLALPAIHWSAALENHAYQIIANLEVGSAYLIGGWVGPPAQLSPASINLCRCDSNGITGCYPPGLVVTTYPFGTWQHLETQVIINEPPPVGESMCLVLGSGDVDPWGNTLFDDLYVELDGSTSVDPTHPSPMLSFRPNPATDKLWVDLREAPISVVAIDATGRSLTLQNFQHTSRTLELDVSTLPSGVNMVRILLPSGNRTIRFIKT